MSIKDQLIINAAISTQQFRGISRTFTIQYLLPPQLLMASVVSVDSCLKHQSAVVVDSEGFFDLAPKYKYLQHNHLKCVCIHYSQTQIKDSAQKPKRRTYT